MKTLVLLQTLEGLSQLWDLAQAFAQKLWISLLKLEFEARLSRSDQLLQQLLTALQMVS
jgi:hypothetical protein